jgi:hypothetical protein
MLHKRVASLYIKKANIAKAIPANDYVLSDNAFDLGSECFDRVFGHPFIFNEADTKNVTHLMKLIPSARSLLRDIEDELKKVESMVNEYYAASEAMGKQSPTIMQGFTHGFIAKKKNECDTYIDKAMDWVFAFKTADNTMGDIISGQVAWGDKNKYNAVRSTVKRYNGWSTLESNLYSLVDPKVLPAFIDACLDEVKTYEEEKKNSGIGGFFRNLFKKASSSVENLSHLLAKSHQLGLSTVLKKLESGSIDSGLSVYQAIVYRETAYQNMANHLGSLPHEDDPFKHFVIANLSKFQNNKHGALPIDEDISFIHEHILASNAVVSAWKTMKNNKG